MGSKCSHKKYVGDPHVLCRLCRCCDFVLDPCIVCMTLDLVDREKFVARFARNDARSAARRRRKASLTSSEEAPSISGAIIGVRVWLKPQQGTMWPKSGVQVLKRRPAVSLPQKILSNTFTTAQEKPKTDESSQQDAYGDQTDVDEKRHEILEAALAHVSQHGWSIQALAAGAKTVGYPGVAHGMFPRGGAELVLFFEEQCNAKHETVLAETVKERMDRKAFMCTAIEKRLRMIIPYIKNWSQAQAILATPENAPAAMAVLAELVDNIWYHAGDRSADFNWYLKRASLGVAYKATELCMLQDSSSDFKDTWQFLERRIENLQTFGGVVRQLQGITPVCAGAFITVRNILGMANQRR